MPSSSDDVYTHGHHDSVLVSHRWRTVANSAAYLLPHLVVGASLLDVGCGPGTITAEMADLVVPGQVIGIDAVGEVVAAATAAHQENRPHLRFDTGDVYAIDAPDDTFDIVHAHQVLQHLSDPVAALVEMGRVCRPGGVVACRDADYAAMTWYPTSPDLDRWLQLYRSVAHGNGAEPDAGRRLVDWAAQAGFETVDAGASVWCFATPAERGWWCGLWADRVVESSMATQAIDAGLSDLAELESLAAAWRSWAEDGRGWFAVLHGEILCTAAA